MLSTAESRTFGKVRAANGLVPGGSLLPPPSSR